MLIGAQMMGFSVNAGMFDALSVTPGLGLAFVRLRAAYSGKCINVRRPSDNATMDIGFRNGLLDTATLLAFCGSGNGFVTTWYNQGPLGSAGNATQSTAASQPQIVSAGAVVTDGGQPAMQFTSTTQYLKCTGLGTGTFNSSAGFFLNIIAHYTGAASGGNAYVLTNRTSAGWFIRFQGASTYAVASSGVGTGAAGNTQTVGSSLFNTQMILSLNYNGTAYVSRYNGNQASATGAFNVDPTNTLYISTEVGTAGITGYISQVVGLNASISNADWATLELAEAALYGISGVTQ